MNEEIEKLNEQLKRLDEEYERLSGELNEKSSGGENIDFLFIKLNEIMDQKLKIINYLALIDIYKKTMKDLSNRGQEFIKKENRTMKEYNEILRSFDEIRENLNVEGHFYFEEIYFIINVNILTPLITINSIDIIMGLYDKFMNKAIETLKTDEEKEQLQRIYNEDCSKLKSAIEDRRNNYPTIHEEITKKQCMHCLRTIDIESEYCEYCGNKIEDF